MSSRRIWKNSQQNHNQICTLWLGVGECIQGCQALPLLDEEISMKTLNNSNTHRAQEQVEDLEVYGRPDVWKLLSKASSEEEGWMKSTKVMELDHADFGCLVQVTTQQRNPDGSYSLAEAITYVPGVTFENFVERK
jgi:hypothetical protein